MTLLGFVWLLLAAVCIAIANLLLKIGIAHAGGFALSLSTAARLLRQPAFCAGCVLTIMASLVWFRVLSVQKLSTAYPLFVSLTYSLITAGAIVILRERISAQKLFGLLVIVAGIAIVALGDRA